MRKSVVSQRLSGYSQPAAAAGASADDDHDKRSGVGAMGSQTGYRPLLLIPRRAAAGREEVTDATGAVLGSLRRQQQQRLNRLGLQPKHLPRALATPPRVRLWHHPDVRPSADLRVEVAWYITQRSKKLSRRGDPPTASGLLTPPAHGTTQRMLSVCTMHGHQ